MRTIAVTRDAEMPVSNAVALATLWNVQSLERYEPKVDALEIGRKAERWGAFRARGRFAGLPWSGEFGFQLNDRGFHSESIHTYGSRLTVSGGFRVEPLQAATCRVVHYERYRLPVWAVPLKPLIAWYVRRSMDQELANLRELMTSSVPLQAA